MSENQNISNTIKSVALQILPGAKVLLFGSRARQDFDNHSDYDIMLVVPENIEIQKNRY